MSPPSTSVFPELVVSSWPFRLNTVIYDPLLRIDVASWDLEILEEAPDLIWVPPALVDPRRSYRKRSKALIEALDQNQPLLRAVYQVEEGERVEVHPVCSDDVERELGAWAQGHGLTTSDLSLRRLEQLLDRLSEWDAARHHAFCADWWESFELPSGATRPSAFRTASAPGGSLYVEDGDRERGLRSWQEDLDNRDFETFSLWAVLRAHWGWRLEFSDQPRPRFAALQRLEELFS